MFLGSLSEFKAGTKTTWVFPRGRKPTLRMRCLRLKCHVPSWTSGSPALSPSSSGLGPRRLPSRDLTQEAENPCEVLQHKGLALPNPGAGLTAQASLPRGSSSPPRSTQGDVEARREGASPRGPLLAVQHPSSGRGDHPLPLLLAQHHPSVGTPRHRRLMEVFPTPALCTTLGERPVLSLPWSRCHRHHPISQVRLWKHSPRLHWHLAKPLSPGASISSSVLWRLFRKWGRR